MSIRTSQNVFRDLGFDTEEAENLRIGAALMVEPLRSRDAPRFRSLQPHLLRPNSGCVPVVSPYFFV
jgi:hypothetical protein